MRTWEYLLFKEENVGKVPTIYNADTDIRGDMHARESRKDLLIMAGDMHARETKKDGSRKTPLQKAQACEGLTFYEFSYTQAQKHRRAIRRTEHTHPDPDQQTTEEGSEPMALSEEARQWMIENGMEGLLRIADAPPHAVVKKTVQRWNWGTIAWEPVLRARTL